VAKKAGDFYVNLGLKGSEDSQRKLDKQNDSFKDLKKVSTEAKLAILAMLYGVERMVSQYGAAGQEVQNFSTITDIASQKLLAYEAQAQKVGAANGELSSTFDKLQQQMFGVMTGSGVPPWLATITGTLQGMGVQFSPEERKNTAQAWGANPDLFFQRMSQFANNKILDHWKTTNVLREMGFSDNIIAGMMQHKFDPAAIQGAMGQVWSDGTVKNLAKVNSEWVNMGLNFKKFMGTITGNEFPRFVGDLSKVATELERIGYDLDKIGQKTGFFAGFDDLTKQININLKGIDDLLNKKYAKGAGEVFGFHRTAGGLMGTNMTNRISIVIHAAGDQGAKIGRIVKTEVLDVMGHITNMYSAKASR
jgi:hypothetical protein